MAVTMLNKKEIQEPPFGLHHSSLHVEKSTVFFYSFLNDYIQFGNSSPEHVIDIMREVWKSALLHRNQ